MKYRWISKFSKLAVGRNIRLVVSFNQGTASLQPYQLELQQIFDLFGYSLQFWHSNSKISIWYSFTYVL